MKYAISLIAICFIVILSCNTGKDSAKLFSQNSLPTEQFTINTARDTVLQTGNGALLKIPAGALENKNGSSVTLEIKEAYSMQQIIKAGLFTQSNGEPLSSGGMIYINATAGQEVTFKQKIQVAIPADFLQEGMQLYKGNEQADGTINWENPDTLPENKQLTTVEKGKALFQNHCASCHIIGKDATGPDLAHFMKRFPLTEEGLRQYYFHDIDYNGRLTDSSGEEYGTDFREHQYVFNTYKCNLHRGVWVSSGTMPSINREEYLSLFQYIQNESDRLDLPMPWQTYLKDCVDSCEMYKLKTAELKKLRALSEKERQKFIEDNDEMTKVTPDSALPVVENVSLPSDFDKKVSPENFEATYYQFSVESFGWYNIDILLQEINNGVAESELFVRIIGEYRQRINVFLIIPSAKVYGEGGPSDIEDKYAFFYKNGKIPLPQGVKAYILAVTEQDEKIAFALKEFTTDVKQEFVIALEISTKENFEAALKDFDTDRLHIKVNKSKNADSILAKDKAICDIDLQLKDAEKLKPRNCDCDCGMPYK